MVGSRGRSEVGSAPSSDLVRSWGKTCGQKMGQPGLKTGAPTSDQGLVGRWGRTALRPGRSEDGAQHIHWTVNSFYPEFVTDLIKHIISELASIVCEHM